MFYFEGDCLAGEKMEMKIMTSRKINPTKIAVKGAGRGKNELKQYNKLTQMCLRLGFLSENELKNLNDVTLKKVDDQLKNTTNLHVKFKPVPSKKDPNLEAIGLATLQSVALAQEKNTKTQ
jgi:hypothetical protein